MLNKEILYRIDKLQDIFTIEGYSDPIVFVEQIAYLIFIRYLNDVGTDLVKDQIDWNKIKSLSGREIIKHLKEITFPTIRSNKEIFNVDFMQNADLEINRPDVVEELIYTVDIISNRNSDEIGEIFEYILSKSLSSQNHRQYFTARHLINMVIEIIEPTPEESICDPACGTAGFLVQANEYIMNKFQNKNTPNILMGYEINSRIANLARMNLFCHSIRNTNIKCIDSLSNLNRNDMQYDVIISNPPVGIIVDKQNRVPMLASNTSSSQLLFFELIMKSLKLNGRSAVFVPEGLLFGASSVCIELRKNLVENYRIDGIVSLPNGVFMPYTNAKSSVIFFTKVKNEDNKPSTEKVYFFDVKSDGYTLDRKRIKITENSLPELIDRWKTRDEDWHKWSNLLEAENRKDGNQQVTCPTAWDTDNVWYADFKSIQDNQYNLSADAYRPRKTNYTEYVNPKQLLGEILEIEEEVVQRLKDLIRETEIYG